MLIWGLQTASTMGDMPLAVVQKPGGQAPGENVRELCLVRLRT